MFRLRPRGLPEDPSFPHNIEKLGYFIDQKNEIKNKEYPTDYYPYHINRNERYVDTFREALLQCVRTEILNRLASLNIKPYYLPQLTTIKPVNEASVPILMSPPEKMRKCEQIILVNNNMMEDLGIFSYRIITKEGGIEKGSVISLIKNVLKRASPDGDPNHPATPGFIVLNPGQLLYSYRHERAMTMQSWYGLPRASGMHDATRIHPTLNRVESNHTAQEHVKFVFDNVISNNRIVSRDAYIFCIARDLGAQDLADYLDKNWLQYNHRVMALALANPGPHTIETPSFADFLRAKTRAWMVSSHAKGTPLANPTAMADVEAIAATGGEIHPFPLVASGEELWTENIIPLAHNEMLDWFEEVAKQGAAYVNPELELPQAVLDELKEAEEAEAARKQQDANDWPGLEQGEDFAVDFLGEEAFNA